MNDIEIEATGYAPETVRGIELARQAEQLDSKRGVLLRLIRADTGHIASVTYTTGWEQERPFTWVMRGASLDDIARDVRMRAKDMLPPGAGYPATPQYAERQRKLREQLETLTLVALTSCLKRISSSVP